MSRDSYTESAGAAGPSTPGTPTYSQPAATTDAPSEPARAESAVHFTRAAALWSAVVSGLLVLIVLLIFISQNTESQAIAFLGWTWTLPLGVAILGAAVLGGLITVAVGITRIFQLRRAAKRNLRGGRQR